MSLSDLLDAFPSLLALPLSGDSLPSLLLPLSGDSSLLDLLRSGETTFLLSVLSGELFSRRLPLSGVFSACLELGLGLFSLGSDFGLGLL